MKIAQIHIEQVRAGEETQVLVVLHADNGASGVGEAASTLIPRALSAALETAGQYLLGQDPFDRNSILMRLAKTGGSGLGEMLPAVMNGIEAASLDLTGKQLDVPACQFFGGAVRNAYARPAGSLARNPPKNSRGKPQRLRPPGSRRSNSIPVRRRSGICALLTGNGRSKSSIGSA